MPSAPCNELGIFQFQFAQVQNGVARPNQIMNFFLYQLDLRTSVLK
jgi:hypothetical protein